MARKFGKPRATMARTEVLEQHFLPPPAPPRYVRFVAASCRFDTTGAHIGGVFDQITAWVLARQSGAGIVLRTIVDPVPEPGYPMPPRLHNTDAEPAEVGHSSLLVVGDNRSPGEVRAALWATQKEQMLEHPSQPTTDHEFLQASREKRVRVSVLPLFNPRGRR